MPFVSGHRSCHWIGITTALILLQLQWHHCFGLMVPSTKIGCGTYHFTARNSLAFLNSRHSRRTLSRLMMQQQKTSSITSQAQVIAKSPELGGEIIRIRSSPDEDEESFLGAMAVPTFAVVSNNDSENQSQDVLSNQNKPAATRLGLEGILRNSNAFVIENALSPEVCESILNTCEDDLKFGNFNAGKNNHGAMQIVISQAIADELLQIIGPHVDLEGVLAADKELRGTSSSIEEEGDGDDDGSTVQYALRGINRRFRVYRYAPDQNEMFAPHIDAGFPPGGVSLDDDVQQEGTPFLHWDSSHQYPTTNEVVSRLTVLMYLNEDFTGGHTKFYEPVAAEGSVGSGENAVIASFKPRTGSILVFPQAVSEAAVERARTIWPLHEGSPVTSGNRPKYVIRSDVLFETIVNDEQRNMPEEEKVLFQYDDAVRNVFLPTSPLFSKLFLHHTANLYNPHMGVENAGPMLYSFVRFTKCRNIVEVGAGYTTLFLLQALKDNDDEMERVVNLDLDGRLKMLDYPFGTPRLEEWVSSSASNPSSSLLCIDNCEHQRETASSAVSVARTLGLDPYLQFLKGDAFDALDTHFSTSESIDLLWCDFGVGARMTEYATNVWKYVKPGGYLLCHSTITNARTREWLEGIRERKGVEATGIPADEYTELSLLEPHKRFQNSITILQKRMGEDGKHFQEPLYSEYA